MHEAISTPERNEYRPSADSRLRREQTAVYAPLDSDSLIRRYFDNRTAFTGLSRGILQLMYPRLGAGVAEHSDFFEDPWDRIMRSLPWIHGVVFDADGDATGRQVRGFHNTIHGTDEKGRKYHALEPETFWWAHATFFDMARDNADTFSHHTLSAAERARMYSESLTWYKRYGMPMRDVPTDYWSFYDKWNDICDNVLEMTPAAEKAVEKALTHDSEKLPMVPEEIWPLVKLPAANVLGRLAIGGLPERVRERFAIPFSSSDKVQYELFALAIRQNWWLVPDRVRYHPRAYEGIKHDRRHEPWPNLLRPRSMINFATETTYAVYDKVSQY